MMGRDASPRGPKIQALMRRLKERGASRPHNENRSDLLPANGGRWMRMPGC